MKRDVIGLGSALMDFIVEVDADVGAAVALAAALSALV